MSKLKEINGKYYQECEVILLPTQSKSNISMDAYGRMYFGNYPENTPFNQHLYITSNEEIKEGDWFMNRQYMIEEGKEEYAIWRCGDITPNSNPKKIIATTDTSLTIIDYTDCEYPLPQPSKEFIKAYIKAYNEGKPITKVLVEYIYPNTINFGNCIYKEINGDGSYYELINGEVEKTKSLNELINLNAEINFRLKVNSSNEITIKKVKDSWTREEVIIDIEKAMIQGLDLGQYRDKWIEKNL